MSPTDWANFTPAFEEGQRKLTIADTVLSGPDTAAMKEELAQLAELFAPLEGTKLGQDIDGELAKCLQSYSEWVPPLQRAAEGLRANLAGANNLDPGVADRALTESGKKVDEALEGISGCARYIQSQVDTVLKWATEAVESARDDSLDRHFEALHANAARILSVIDKIDKGTSTIGAVVGLFTPIPLAGTLSMFAASLTMKFGSAAAKELIQRGDRSGETAEQAMPLLVGDPQRSGGTGDAYDTASQLWSILSTVASAFNIPLGAFQAVADNTIAVVDWVAPDVLEEFDEELRRRNWPGHLDKSRMPGQDLRAGLTAARGDLQDEPSALQAEQSAAQADAEFDLLVRERHAQAEPAGAVQWDDTFGNDADFSELYAKWSERRVRPGGWDEDDWGVDGTWTRVEGGFEFRSDDGVEWAPQDAKDASGRSIAEIVET